MLKAIRGQKSKNVSGVEIKNWKKLAVRTILLALPKVSLSLYPPTLPRTHPSIHPTLANLGVSSSLGELHSIGKCYIIHISGLPEFYQWVTISFERNFPSKNPNLNRMQYNSKRFFLAKNDRKLMTVYSINHISIEIRIIMAAPFRGF